MPQRHTGGAEVWLDLILNLMLHGLSGQSHTMAPLSLGKTLVPTKKEAGWGLVMSKDGKKWNEQKDLWTERWSGLVGGQQTCNGNVQVGFSVLEHKQGIIQQ